MTRRATGRWRGVVALSLFAAAVGLLAQRPAVLLLATVGVGYALYPRVVPDAPDPDLSVERSLTPIEPDVDERVAVETTVRNEGDRWLPDVRVVDGVPSLLPVVDGTPRTATALGPGQETTLRYAVAARQGKHRFEPTTVFARDVSGAVERRTSVAEPDVIDCGASVSEPALRGASGERTGSLLTEVGGSGIEFFATREYRPGDPMKRVDWRRLARDGELATVEFREERAATVVLCVDAGPSVGGDPLAGRTPPRAVARSVAAADRLSRALVDANHEVGLAAFGPAFFWMRPGLGRTHGQRLRRALDEAPVFAPSGTGDGPVARVTEDDGPHPGPGASSAPGASDAGAWDLVASTPVADGGDATAEHPTGLDEQTAALRERLGSDSQVTMLTPLADDGVVDAIESLEAAGHPVVVVSPDATATETVGNRLAASERARRVRALRRSGVPVVDWQDGEHLGTELATTLERFA